MTGDKKEVPRDVRARIDAHLDAVETAARRSGAGREEVRSITDDVEAQILDMLAARVPDRAPILDDLAAVLAQLDPPEAYAQGPDARPARTVPPAPPTPPVPAKPRFAWPAIVGAFGLVVFLGYLFIVVPIMVPVAMRAGVYSRMQAEEPVVVPQENPGPAEAVPQNDRNGPPTDFRPPQSEPRPLSAAEASLVTTNASWSHLSRLLVCFGLVPTVAGLWATAFGLVAIVQIQRSHGRMRGMWLAVVDVVTCPVVGVAVLAVVLLFTA